MSNKHVNEQGNESLEEGPISLRDSVKAALFSLRHFERYYLAPNRLPEPTLEIDCIGAVERALDCCLPFEALALLANHDSTLCEYGIDLGEIVDNTLAARKNGCSNQSIALGRHPDNHAFYCIGKNGKRSRTIGITEIDNFDGGSMYYDLPSWLNTHVERRHEFALDDFPELASWSLSEQQLADFTLSLV